MMTDKYKWVERNFSDKAETYDAEAKVQKYCAGKLAERLQQGAIPDGDILEIGCGSGFLTRHIASMFPDRNYLVTDISSSMLKICRQNMTIGKAASDKLSYSVLNGEDVSLNKGYSLIISGLTFQWFRNMQGSIASLSGLLDPRGGILAFSCLERESFPEWKQICCELDLPFTGNRLPSYKELKGLEFPFQSEGNLIEESLCFKYPTARHFFHNLKRIGAGTSLNSKHLNPNQMKRLLRHWDAKFPEGITVTYNIVYGMIRRNNKQ